MKRYKEIKTVEDLAALYQKLKGSIFLRLNKNMDIKGEYKECFYDNEEERVLGYELKEEMTFAEFVNRVGTQF